MLSPVTLTGELVTLEPLHRDHHDDLVAAASDGRLWELWYTSVPSPETMRADIGRKLAEPTTLPFTVRRNDTGAVVGMTTYLNAEPDVPRLEIGATWTAASAQRTAVNAESKLLLLTHAFEVLGCRAVEFRTHWQTTSRGRRSPGWVPSRTPCCATIAACPTAPCGTPSSSRSWTPSGPPSATGCGTGLLGPERGLAPPHPSHARGGPLEQAGGKSHARTLAGVSDV